MSEGKILLVGIGPGGLEHMTARARDAIAAADTLIGYTRYIRLLEGLLDGKEVVAKPMTAELERAALALERAREGRTVALVSSGDVGIYGMAAPTYEHLLESGWHPGDGLEVEVVPGCSALSTCASLVGAPLGHDFCTISLSDLLTPWPVIARRLEAAARADFAIALYNPKSGRRTRQVLEARRIMLQHRTPETPVAVVQAAYRPEQRIELTTLGGMDRCDIGMLSTLLIGNRHTVLREGLMLTPRGYTRKYDGASGEVQEGERRGRSLSTGLDGWLMEVRERSQAGADVAELAAAYGLSPEYVASSLSDLASPFPEAEDGPLGNSKSEGNRDAGASSQSSPKRSERDRVSSGRGERALRVGQDFGEAERAAVYRAIRERRDMRHFRPGPVDSDVLARLLGAAVQAPSVGFMQPWRFIRVLDPDRRQSIHAMVEQEQEATAEACGERAQEVRRLKLQGILDCSELLVVALADGRERYVLGRRTMPEMDLCSVSCAIQNLWLAARAEGLGMGWVSLFEPDTLAQLLELPEGARPVAVLCLGQVDTFYSEPMLETLGWDSRRLPAELVFRDTWGRRDLEE